MRVLPGVMLALFASPSSLTILRGSRFLSNTLWRSLSCSRFTYTVSSKCLRPNSLMRYVFPHWRTPRTRSGLRLALSFHATRSVMAWRSMVSDVSSNIYLLTLFSRKNCRKIHFFPEKTVEKYTFFRSAMMPQRIWHI